MKNSNKFLLLSLSLLLLISSVSYGSKRIESSAPEERKAPSGNSVYEKTNMETSKKGRTDFKNDRKNVARMKHEIKEKMRDLNKTRSDVGDVILVIIAILLPPLAVFLVDGLKGPFWLDILLTLLFYVPGLIYALYRIFKD
jgi:uncharacterized membrane protein YqaE (UPF0057 family)